MGIAFDRADHRVGLPGPNVMADGKELLLLMQHPLQGELIGVIPSQQVQETMADQPDQFLVQ